MNSTPYPQSPELEAQAALENAIEAARKLADARGSRIAMTETEIRRLTFEVNAGFERWLRIRSAGPLN